MASLDELRKQDMLRRAGIQPPMPGLMERAFPNTLGALKDRQSEIDSARKTGGLGAAVGQSIRTAGNPLIGFLDDSARGFGNAITPAAQALKTFATGDATPIGQAPIAATAAKAPMPAAYSNEGRSMPQPEQPGAQTSAPSTPSNPLVRQITPGIYRQGNSFSDSAEGAAAGARPAPVSAQNMAAADALAARYATPAQTQEQAAPGAGLYVGADTGGYGLLDKNRIAQRNAMMDVQQLKPGSGKALAALLQQQTDAPKFDLEREQMAQRGQESAADRLMRGQELNARLGESAADRALKGQEVADNALTNAAKREALGVETGAAKQLADLRSAYVNAKTPEEQAAVAAKINALAGKGAPQDEYMAVGGGESVVDPATGLVVKNPDVLVNKRTGQPVQGQATKAQAALPPGMVRQVGTSGGKPVYEDANGKRFMGG